MGEMDGMDVVGFVSLKQVSDRQVDPQCKAIIEQVDAGLKANPGQAALIGKPFKTRDEAVKKARYLRGQIKLLGINYCSYGVSVKGSDVSGYQVYGVVKKPAVSGKAGKGKGIGKGKPSKGPQAVAKKAENAVTLPSPEQIKGMGAQDKLPLHTIKQVLENKDMAAMVEPALKG